MKFGSEVFIALGSEARLKLLKYLLSGKPIPAMSERELARIVGIPNMAVNRAMKEFEKIHLVSFNKAGNTHIWRLNIGSYAYAALKSAVTAAGGFEAREALVDTLKKALKGLPAQKAVLFGSVAHSREKEDSDIDLFVLAANESDKAKIEAGMEKTAGKISELFGNTLSFYILTNKQYNDPARNKIAGEIEKGIKLA